MNAKKLLGVVAAILAIVLAIWFPDRDGGDGSRNADAPAASASASGERAPSDLAGATSAGTSKEASKVASDASSSSGSAATPGSKSAATSGSAAKPAANAKTGADQGASSKRVGAGAAAAVRRDIGFGSERSFDEHYEKHGAEFGSITQAKYLELAQDLRDAPAGGNVLEAVRDDGVISRFDTKSGAFVAFNKNGTIRTFFKPNDGVRYFERQAEKPH